MKKCPKCSEVFDDSWKICLHCSVALSDDPSIISTNPELKEKRSDSSFSFRPKNKVQAENAIKLACLFLLLIGIFRVLIVMLMGVWTALLPNLILPVLTIVFYFTKSRIVAILLFLISLIGAFTNITGSRVQSVTLLIMMIPAIQGAFTYHKLKSTENRSE